VLEAAHKRLTAHASAWRLRTRTPEDSTSSSSGIYGSGGGLVSVKKGKLLVLAAGTFDALATVDKNLPDQ
jgi:hypothetical protein